MYAKYSNVITGIFPINISQGVAYLFNNKII